MSTQVLPLVGPSAAVAGVAATSGTAAPPQNVPSGVTAGTYGDATHVGQFTVDENGRVTNALDIFIPVVTRAKGRFVYV